MISSLKVATAVQFKEFRGVSTILRHTAAAQRYGPDPRFELLACDLADPRLGLYAALERGIERLGLRELLLGLSLCVLPPEAWHVTLGDAFNDANIADFDPRVQDSLKRFLGALPGSLVEGLPAGLPADLFTSTRAGEWRLRLRYHKLALWNDALVAQLEPADGASYVAYERLCEERRQSDLALVRLGKEPLLPWQPHCSLAYLASPQFASEVRARLADWDAALRAAAGSDILECSSYGLYAFVDMTRFFTL